MTGLLAALLIAAPVSARPWVLGFDFPAWWHDAYSSPSASASLALMAKTGASHFAVVPTWYLATPESSVLEATEKTASEESLRAAMRLGRSLGLRPVLKPHVDVRDGSPRALLRPRDAAAFFRSYRERLLFCARLAAEERAELLIIGTELFSLATPLHAREWERLIRDLRAVYPGPLTYAANFYDFPLVPFWGSLDLIGIDAYFPLAGGSDERLLKASWRAYVPGIAALSRLHGKPVLFTEVGTASQEGANRRPWDWRDRAPVDLEEQAAYFRALVSVFDPKPWFAGFLQWGWEVFPDAGGPRDKSMTVQGKPAQRVLEGYFRRRAAPPPLGGRLERSVAEAVRGVEPGALSSL